MRILILFSILSGVSLAETPVDRLWQSDTFRRAFTASYGIDARIEPSINTAERETLEKVAEAMKQNNRDTAIAALTGHDGLNKSAALLFSLGNLRFEQEKNDDAIENFQAAITLHPNFRDAHRNLAVVFVNQSEFDKARPHLVRAMELGAQDGLTLGLLGYVHSTAGQQQAALQAYRMAQLTQPDEIQWKLGEAEALLALDNPQATVSIYDELLALRPQDAGLWMGQADAYYKLGETEKSIANLEFVRRMEKLSPTDTMALGHLYLNQSMNDIAVNCYLAAIKAENEPATLTKAIDAVDNLIRFRQWQSAKILAEEIAALPAYADELQNPDSRAQLNRSLALLELESGDAEKGAAMVEELLKSDPTDAKSMLLLARYKVKQKDLVAAQLLYEQAANEPEYEAEALRLHGQLLVDQSDYESALDLLERAQELDPSDSLASYIESVRSLAR